MKVVFTKHAKRKFKFLEELKWLFTPEYIKKSVKNPDGIESDPKRGAKVALKSIDERHNIRIIYFQKGDIITVITFYPIRKKRYEKE